MIDLQVIKQKLPEAMILEFLNTNDDCTIDLIMLIELGVYSRKDYAVEVLKNNFEEGGDFSRENRKNLGRGRSSDLYLLTSNCFKEMCMLAETPSGKLVRKYYIQVEKLWKREILRKLAEIQERSRQSNTVEFIQSQDASEQIKSVVADWLGHIFAKTRILVNEVSRESDYCFALIVKKAADEQIDLVNAIKKGVDQIELEVMARGAINRIVHRISHQPGKISKVIDEQVYSSQEEFVQMLVTHLMALQVLKQPALPPVEEHPVQRTATERRQSVIAFLFDLVAEYGSLEAIPRRRKGRPTANLEADWGSAKLSKQFGLCANTILDIWDEVDEAIKQHGVTEARNRLLI